MQFAINTLQRSEKSRNIKICGVLNSDLICSFTLLLPLFRKLCSNKRGRIIFIIFHITTYEWSRVNQYEFYSMTSVCCVPTIFFALFPPFYHLTPSISIITHYFHPHRCRVFPSRAESIEHERSERYTRSSRM